MLAAIIYVYYYQQPVIKQLSAYGLSGFTGTYLLYLVSFGGAYLLQRLFYKNNPFLAKPWFWVILFTAPAIFSFREHFNVHHGIIRQYADAATWPFWYRCTGWLTGLATALMPVFVIWKLKDSKEMPFYGITRANNAKVYLLMVVCMVPLITLAATRPDFLSMYPRARMVSVWQLQPDNVYYIMHEFFYSLDFITIEFFFRGFLILSLARLCGPQCIVPAACFYCCIHLGKPMGEAISSFAGGLLLGIVSYNTQSVRGGLIVHLGIAWGMEIAGFVVHAI